MEEKYKLMERREFQKILADSLLNIVEVGIKKGYFKEEKREELNDKIIEIFKNGIEYDIPGSVVYGQYVPSWLETPVWPEKKSP